MLLRSIRLENIRSYIDETITFNPGSILLFGDIGSGKSSVLLAIEFALFGLIKGDVSGTTLLRHGKKDGSVRLELNIDDKDVVINRRLKRKNDQVQQDSGYIIIDNKKIEGTPIELKSKILELCGYPEDLLNKNTSLIYRYTVYTPQEDMKSILFESKEERLDTLRRIFDIDKYKIIRENALNYAKELRNTKKILETKISDLEQKKIDLESRNIILEKSYNDKSMIEDSLKEFQEHQKSKEEELKGYEEKIYELNILKKDLEICSINIKNKRQDLERTNKELNIVDFRIKEYENKQKDLGVIDVDEESLKDNLKDSEDKLSRIKTMKDAINERLENKKDDLNKLMIEDQLSLNMKSRLLAERLETKNLKEESLMNTQKELEKVNIEMNTLKISKNNSIKLIKQIEGLNTCPTCLQNVDFSHKVKITDRENSVVLDCDRKISDSDKRQKDIEKNVNALKSDLEQLRRDELELNELKMKLNNIADKIQLREQLEKDVEELTKKKEKIDSLDVDKLMESISKNRKILNNIAVKKHLIDSLSEKHAQKKDLDSRIRLLDEELKMFISKYDVYAIKIKDYTTIEKDFKDRKAELETIKSKINEINIALANVKKDIEVISSDVKKIKEDIEIKNKIKDKINYIIEMNYWITEHFINLVSTIEKSIMHKVHREFDGLFRQWFSILMDDENLDVSIDEEFTPIIEQNNYQTFIDNLSGGEKTSIALAYRLSLNKVINDFIHTIKTKDMIILDEPTDGFSSEQLDKMRDVLNELNIKQLIIVSHEPKMESFVENIIRIEKHEHNSKVVA